MATNTNQKLDFPLILSGVAMFLILSAISYGATNIPRLFMRGSESTPKTSVISDPKLTKSGIEKSKNDQRNQVETLDYSVNILDKPISTPAFVSNPQKLTDYLGKNSKTIKITGKIAKAYLYIKTDAINIANESVYFYIVDGKTVAGHLLPSKSLMPDNGNEFLYDLSKLPLVQLPYSLKNTPSYENVIDKIFNVESSYNNGNYYIGAFVSTTQLPNQVEKIEIRYSCIENENCEIQLQI